VGSDSQPIIDIPLEFVRHDGGGGTVTLREGRPYAIAGFTIRNRTIVEMDVLADPERLSQLDLVILDGSPPHPRSHPEG
jgi:hypothetical protein